MSTTLKFSPKAHAGAPHTVFFGPKSLLAPSSLGSSLPGETHAAAAAVQAGKDKVAKAHVGERTYTFAAVEEKTSRWMGAIRGDVVEGLVKKHLPSKEDGKCYSI
jgi:hypothetical protein